MKKAKASVQRETDSVYFLKLLLYFVLGTIWVKHNGYVILPAGLILGVVLSRKDHFAIDRKIEYAVLIVSAILGLIGYGVYFAV